jgi:hypothetical protein
VLKTEVLKKERKNGCVYKVKKRGRNIFQKKRGSKERRMIKEKPRKKKIV